MTERPLELLQIDFIGPIVDEKGKKKQILVCVDNHSKWVWTKLTKSCRAVEAAKFVKDIIEIDGVPKEVKTDNATAFKSDRISQTDE